MTGASLGQAGLVARAALDGDRAAGREPAAGTGSGGGPGDGLDERALAADVGEGVPSRAVRGGPGRGTAGRRVVPVGPVSTIFPAYMT